MGIPTIITLSKGLERIAQNGTHIFGLNNATPEEIQEAISYLYGNKEVANQIGKNARELCNEKYTWSEHTKALLNVYANAISPQRS